MKDDFFYLHHSLSFECKECHHHWQSGREGYCHDCWEKKELDKSKEKE